jgi:hypothetical protein
MGEEKPDEELMGKRKPSPRLSPTPLGAGTIIVTLGEENIRQYGNKLERGPSRVNGEFPRFCNAGDCGNITPANL